MYAPFRGKKHFGSLDGLRALSIVGVVWHHVARGRDLFFAEEGASGVPLFFAISGFLITTLLLRERSRTGEISLTAFYARRSLRIFPLYYTVLLVYVAAVTLAEHGDAREAFFRNLPFFVTYTSNWFVDFHSPRVIFAFAWSLATEEQFYVLWPSVEKFLGAKLKNLPVAVALALVLGWALEQADVVPHDIVARPFLLSIAPAICLGVVLAHALHDQRTFDILWRALGWKWLSPLMLAAVIALLLAPGGLGTALAGYCAMVLLVAACVVREDHALAPFLGSRAMASIGQVSYGIYLLHMLVVNVVEKALGRAGVDARAIVFPAAFLAAWGVAWVSFRFYESRFLKLKERFVR